MNRTFALAALALASSAAFGQTDVTVYGILDVGLHRTTGLRQGTVDNVVSGIMEGSRLGVRGNEDLGGGFRATFTAESRLEADYGGVSNRPNSGSQLPDRLSQAPLLGLPSALQPVVDQVGASIGAGIGTNLANNFWDRQVYVGLITPVGGVVLGRMYTPAYEISATFDTLGTQSSLAAGQIASLPASVDIRISNAVQYRIQLGGFTANAMYAAKEGSTTNGRLMGAMARYEGEAFGAGIGYNTRENEIGQKSLSTLTAGGWVALGPGRIYALLGASKDDNPTGLSGIAASLTPVIGAPTAGLVQNAFIEGLKQDARLYHVGYRFTVGVNTIYLAYSTLNDRRPANADVSSYGAVWTYAFSKRTDLNAVATHFNNKNLAQAAPGGAGFQGGVTASAGKDSNNFALGIRHRF